MQVVGITTPFEAHVVSRQHRFHIQEFLILEDPRLDHPCGEVIEAFSYNPLLPMDWDKPVMDKQVLESLLHLGYDVGSDEVHVAKVRLLVAAPRPIQTGCSVRHPAFPEVRSLLVTALPSDGMVLGEIQGTQFLNSSLSEEWKQQLMIREPAGDLREQCGVPFIFDARTLSQYPHVGIFGGSGSGKSFATKVMLEEFMKLSIPCVVLDPHFEMIFLGEEGVPMTGSISDSSMYATQCRHWIAGKDVGVDFTSLCAGDLSQLLQAAGGSFSEAMVHVVQALHRRGDSLTSFSDRLANLVQALEEGRQGLERSLGSSDPMEAARARDLYALWQQHSSLPLASIHGVHWRLRRLERAGLFQSGVGPIVEGLEQCQMVVLQGSSWLLQVFAAYLSGMLYKKRRDYRDAPGEKPFFPPFVIVTDEAHRFAPKGWESPSKSTFREIAQEGRKYGVFLVLATQRPTLLDETITAQLNTKFIFRTVRGSDIATLREETDLTTEEARRLPYLRSGDAFVSSAVLGRTVSIRIRCAHTQSPHATDPFAELRERKALAGEKYWKRVVPLLPLRDAHLLGVLQTVDPSWSVDRLRQQLDQWVADGRLQKKTTPLDCLYTLVSSSQ
ncbi:ATP-binding protein [Pasteuria penetrans]|uniref:ATP-binding protein n=1 Tax=Pasteuria penetrans TaxID=86005 RepID=UPI000F9E529D|nr:ATP-binding protein [Pasteuria penetrans]